MNETDASCVNENETITNEAVQKRKKVKKRRTNLTNLSRKTRSATRAHLLRQNETAEQRRARLQKNLDFQRKKLETETPEERDSRRRYEAKRRKSYLHMKRQQAKIERLNAALKAIDTVSQKQIENAEAQLSIGENALNKLKMSCGTQIVTMPCQSEADEDVTDVCITQTESKEYVTERMLCSNREN